MTSMIHRCPMAVLIVVALCWLAASAPASAETPVDGASFETGSAAIADTDADTDADAELAAYVDGVVDAFRGAADQAGVSVAVVDGGRPLLLRGYGWANAESGAPAAPDTLFQIGSISKTFTWTAVMMLVDRGQLDLDRDVNEYLQQIEVTEAFDAPVTMRHLMTHTAGFEDTVQIFTASKDDPRSRSRALADTQPQRVFPPGARTSYSNWGSELAAQIVADVSGMAYEDVLEHEILQPLGMRSTSMAPPHRLPPDLAARMSAGHSYEDGRLVVEGYLSQGPFGASGRIASSAADMGRWMRFHLNRGTLDGVRLMTPDTHDRMWSLSFDHPETAAGLAHGFERREVNGVVQIGHGGSTRTFVSVMWMAPEQGVGVFASSNTVEPGIGPRIGDRIFARLTGMPEPPAAIEPDRSGIDLTAYVGDYVNNRRSFSTIARAAARSVSVRVRTIDDEPGILRVRTGGTIHRFAPVVGAPDVFENRQGMRLRFIRDADEVVAVNTPLGVHSNERTSGLDRPRTLNIVAVATVLLAVTLLLGAWRRWKQQPETTTPGRQAARAGNVSAVIVLAYVVLLVVTLVSVADLSDDFTAFPTPSVIALSWSGWALVAASLLMVFGLIRAWRGAEWGLWRRLHYSAFALTLVACTGLLWHWNFFGAPLL